MTTAAVTFKVLDYGDGGGGGCGGGGEGEL